MAACRIRVRGLVQGVGFRPLVWRLANEAGLSGWVSNDGEGVDIAIHGDAIALAEFVARLRTEPPPLARIDRIEVQAEDSLADTHNGFRILESHGGSVRTAIGPDAATCHACTAEICDPNNRRWRYAFTTCTHCGPRYTVSRGIPYDRARTSLAPFPLCPNCDAEYTAPADRRFHAETTCCPACGPHLQLLAADGEDVAGDPIAATLARLLAGQIVAIKGLGGFHLACDARNAEAVARLGERKAREEKPFAVMALNPASFAGMATIDPETAKLLQSSAAPIVLCPKGAVDLPGIAPGLGWVGAMVPATPLHLLLWHEAAGQPHCTTWLHTPHPLLLVMTSANPQGEPLVIDNDEACERLAGIADAYLLHNRDIVVRCDDSVLRPAPGGPAFIRRARGYTPLPIALPHDGPAVLAFGGYLKNTICITRGREAFLSQHLGSLDNAASIGFVEETVAHLLQELGVQPEIVAHDLHPDYPSTQLALAFAAERHLPAMAVGHHHAHIAAVCAEHGHSEAVLGLAIDGVGLGPDGGLWGGELLRVEGGECERLGNLSPLALPGGDRAAREPWRMAGSALHAAGHGGEIAAFLAERFSPQGLPQTTLPHDGSQLAALLDRGFNCPPTSSMGRLFDAAAGLLGVRATMRYEAQAAMELESLAERHGPVPPAHKAWQLTAQWQLNFLPLLMALRQCANPAEGAALFHATVAAGLSAWVVAAAQHTELHTVAIGGGCAANRMLMAQLKTHLNAAGVTLLEARAVPPNDGGLALGQAFVARALASRTTTKPIAVQ